MTSIYYISYKNEKGFKTFVDLEGINKLRDFMNEAVEKGYKIISVGRANERKEIKI